MAENISQTGLSRLGIHSKDLRSIWSSTIRAVVSATVPEPVVLGVQVVSVVHRDQSSAQGGGGPGFTFLITGLTVHERVTELCVKLRDCTQDRLNFTGVGFPVREGHKL